MKRVRLSKFVKPERYRLFIRPDLEGFTFSGEETIFLSLGQATRQITLHSKELKIESAEFLHENKDIWAGKISYDKKSETATFTFPKTLAKGKGQLKLVFKGILNDKMRGFYRSRYIHKGKERHMATTQFEATDARRAFPCFDEPAQKAIFDVTLMVPKDLTAISNTIESEITEHESGYKVVKFKPTPKMSTYLLAFIVGDFEFIEAKTSGGVLVRVFVTPGKKHQAKFALETAVKTLEFYNNYFAIPYPLPVLDLIAIPDFSHGAMENWGAVTYRESALLVDPEHSSAANKQWVALVIAHELAHQWFGNLVTMEWWTHLWLNEGFASYIEYLAVDHLFPKWEIWTQFAYADLGIALKLDSLKNTHPIEVEVHHPDEIGEIFDEVSYSKGASVIRMLAGYLGEKDFRDGLRCYLKKHSYKNASTIHLWQAFEKVSKKPVKDFMRNWTAKPGYPVIKVVEEKNKLLLKQSRFFFSPISKKQAGDNTTWNVPMLIQTDKQAATTRLLSEKSSAITKPKGRWVKLNFGESGFYRTDYPAQMLSALKLAAASRQLPALDRLALVRDAFALSESGDLPTPRALELVRGYKNETDYTVWVEIAHGLDNVRNIIWHEPFYPQYREFALDIFKKISKALGFKASGNESHTRALLRSLVLHQLLVFGHEPTVKQALKIFKTQKSVPANIRSVVYQAAAQTGNEKLHEQFLGNYQKETLSEEKNRIGRALGQFAKPALLKKTLKFAMSGHVRIQDTAAMFMSVWNNRSGADLAWDFTKKHWQELVRRYPASGHMLSRFIKPAGYFSAEAKAKDVAKFFKSHPPVGAQRALAQVLEKIYGNAAWRGRDAEHIKNWLGKPRK